MNVRQTKKCLKKQISKLRSDNDLMRRIIADSPKMQELYDAYHKPLNATLTRMQFQEYRAKRFLPPGRPYDAGLITLYRQALAENLFEGIKEHINYVTDAECMTPTITASIFVGVKGDQNDI